MPRTSYDSVSTVKCLYRETLSADSVTDVFAMMLAVASLVLALASVRYIASLLYQVRSGDPRMVVLPALTILAAALLAALPPVVRAERIDLGEMLSPQ